MSRTLEKSGHKIIPIIYTNQDWIREREKGCRTEL